MKDRRVVVTGMGALTPIGNSVEEFWTNAVYGVSGAVEIDSFDTEKFKTKFACTLKDFNPEKYLTKAETRRNDLYTQYALYAASEAIEDSELDIKSMDPFDIGVIWGTGQGGMVTFEDEMKNFIARESDPKFNPFFIPKMLSNMAAGLISIKFGLMGINFSAISACATANTAFMDAFNYIRLGKAKVFVAGGSDSPICESSVGGFNALKALSTQNEKPESASRPFDPNRDGFVMGEGAGALVLEDYEHAVARGATIYAELVGAAMTADAYHITSNHPEGTGASKAMSLAIEEAGLTPEDVDYLNCHATSTPVGDVSEMKAVEKVFGTTSDKLKISGTKSMTGHLLGAAGAIEAILCINSIMDGVIPPTINTKEIDENIALKECIVLGEAERKDVKVAMSNSFGFGGHNSTVVFKKVIS